MEEQKTNSEEVRVDIGLSSEDEARLRALNEGGGSLRDNDMIESSGNPVLDIYRKFNLYFQALGGVKTADKVTFFELLAVMINSGVPLIRSLYVLSDQTTNVKLKMVVRDMAKKVESGKKFSDAMVYHSRIFNEAEIGMVRSGEATGKLNTVLRDMATQAEKSASIVNKIKGAMIYPASIVMIMIGATIVILVKVVPKITDIFAESGTELPTSTRVLIGMSNIAKEHYIESLIVITIALISFWLFKQTSVGKYSIDSFLLKMPIFGEVFKKAALARFSRNLASLMRSGVAIVRALEINANAVGNEVYKKRILMAAEDVAQGIPLGENLNDSKFLFPDMVVSMITVGEQTAKLDEIADKIAMFYEEQVDETIKGLSKMLEPVILVIMGVTVGGLVAAVMQPIMNLTDVGQAL